MVKKLTHCPCCGHDLSQPVFFAVVAKDHEGWPREWCGHQHPTFDKADECSWRPGPVVESGQKNGRPECAEHGGLCFVGDDGDHLYLQVVRNFQPEQPCPHGRHRSECAECPRAPSVSEQIG